MIKYKHKITNIKDLVGITMPIPVYVIDKNPKPFKNKWGMKGGKEFPDRIILTEVGYNKTKDGEYYNVVYYSKNTDYKYYETNTVLPDYEFAVLTGNMKDKLLTKHEESRLDSLHLSLPRIQHRIGSDPEIFVVDEKDNLIPAFTFLKGKTEEGVVTSQGNRVYWDGFQAEFETTSDTCLAYHTDSVYYGLITTLKAAQKVNPKAKLSIKTVFDIPPELLQKSNIEHVSLGCMPSFNVYGDKAIDVPDPRRLMTRSAGGHIHFDLTCLNASEVKTKLSDMVKALDAILGVSCVAMFANYDNPERRKYYGRAGEYRTPKHGLEYRTLSNAWLVHPMIMNIVFDISRIALSFGWNGFLKHWKGTEEEIKTIINTCDVEAAKKMIVRNRAILYNVYQAAYPNITEPQKEKLFEIFFNGMDKYLSNPEDVAKNWLLSGGWATHGEAPDKNFTKAIRSIYEGKKVA